MSVAYPWHHHRIPMGRLVWAAGGPARRLSSVPFVRALFSSADSWEMSKGRMASAFRVAAQAHGPHWLFGL
eukprot:s11780_g1.t1